MGFQNIPVWDLNESDPYQNFSSIYIYEIWVIYIKQTNLSVAPDP